MPIKLILITILYSSSFCSKGSQQDKGCPTGGIGAANPKYKFWTKIPMYNTMIEIKDNSGSVVDTKIMSGYYQLTGTTIEPDPCKEEVGPAIFTLLIGKNYSYTATNESKKWNGMINIPCSPSQCNNVEIK